MPITPSEQALANAMRDFPMLPSSRGAETFNAVVTRQLAETGISRETYERIRSATIGAAQERVMNSIGSGNDRAVTSANFDLMDIIRANNARIGDVALGYGLNLNATQTTALQNLLSTEAGMTMFESGIIQNGRTNGLRDGASFGAQSLSDLNNSLRTTPGIPTTGDNGPGAPRESFNARLTRQLTQAGISRETYDAIRNATIGRAEERVMNSSSSDMTRAATDLMDTARASQARIADVAQMHGLPNITPAQERTLRSLLTQDASVTAFAANAVQTTRENFVAQGAELGQNVASAALGVVRNVPGLGQIFNSMVPAGSTGIPEGAPGQTGARPAAAPGGRQTP